MTTMRQSGHVLRALLLTNHVQRHCVGLAWHACSLSRDPGAHRITVRVAARDGVRLVEQAGADFAREVGAQAVKLRRQRRELLGKH